MYIEKTDDMHGLFPEPPVLTGRLLCGRAGKSERNRRLSGGG